ncbi:MULTISPECIES: hypothetical protein [unclassified Variovorax]|uniref:portal protein n=1 Tax=unclassified Variovorax TaxID=663243 RepID=UPI00076BCFC0|nr:MULTISPECIES: hypothetical protein [unclassified Variovorax]KWT98897.1 conserved hypothetical protein, putative phage associated protein [Variovorax sp. WDL1]PNG56037.1 hypothetical protein CHC07_02451 [Variovorax sp. B4]PNG57461.1 hypothetical protein CHC06_02454 [Variovorax sp. B2]VTV10161.1 hypothetical protein WDL1CHR_01176 [Variovorax sp. WDL1]
MNTNDYPTGNEPLNLHEYTCILEEIEQQPHWRVAADREMDYADGLQRTRLQVALDDVPSTASYRGQQLNATSEAVKSLPAQYQAAMMPFMVSLMDVPFKRDVVEAIRAAAAPESPEAIEKRIREAVQQALANSGAEIKMREVALKEKKDEVEIQKILAEAVQIGVQSAFSAMQGGAQVAAMPQIAPIADVIMAGAGYRKPTPMGDDPNFPQPQGIAAPSAAAPPVQANTSPGFPPIPDDGASSMTGIETATSADNLQGAPA